MTDPEHTKEARKQMFHALHEYRIAKTKVKSLNQYPGLECEPRHGELHSAGYKIDCAVEHALAARDLDPSATITEQNNEISIDDIFARLLLLEAIAYSRTISAKEVNNEHGWELIHAADVLKKYLTYRPDNLSALIMYIRTLVRLNQNQLARTILDDLLKHHPEHQEAWTVLNDFEILEFTERVLTRRPDWPYESFLFLEWLQVYPIGKLP
jgi:hypothetical protein